MSEHSPADTGDRRPTTESCIESSQGIQYKKRGRHSAPGPVELLALLLGMTKSFYRVIALIHATEAEAAALQEQVRLLLCPEPDHAPPCPIPWETMVETVDDAEDVESLQQQIDAERSMP